MERLSESELLGKLEEVETQSRAITGYLDSTSQALKKIRRVRGAAAHKRGWALEERVRSYQTQLAALTAQNESLKTELARRIS